MQVSLLNSINFSASALLLELVLRLVLTIVHLTTLNIISESFLTLLGLNGIRLGTYRSFRVVCSFSWGEDKVVSLFKLGR